MHLIDSLLISSDYLTHLILACYNFNNLLKHFSEQLQDLEYTRDPFLDEVFWFGVQVRIV